MNNLKKYEHLIIATLIVLINFLVKGIFLAQNSLGGDEPFSIYHAQMSVFAIARLLSEGNNPPLYEVVLHFWVKIFGISELSVRFPSLIFSSVTVLFLYKLGVKFLNQRVAIYASAVFIFSNYHIFFAHEARVYAFLGMLSVLSMYYFMGILQAITANVLKLNKGHLVGLIVTNTLIIYAHYFGFFILITQALFLIFNQKLIKGYQKPLLACAGLIAFLYLPNIFVVVHRFLESTSEDTWLKPPNGFNELYNMLRRFSNAPVVAVAAIAALVAAAAKYVFNKNKARKNIYTALITFWFVFVFFFMFGISYLIPMFLDRYIMPAAIAFPLLLGIAVDFLIKTPKYRYVIPAVVLLLFVATTKPNLSNKRNVRETVEKIKTLKTDKTAVYFCPIWLDMNFIYYYNRGCFENYNAIDIKKGRYPCLNDDHIFPIDDKKEINFKTLKNFDKVIFLDADADFSFPNNGILKQLQQKYTLESQYFYPEIFNIYVFKIN